jgi:type I restriction enzyme R subunit
MADDGKPLSMPGVGGVVATEDELMPLSEVVEQFNKRFGTQFSENDKVADLFEESIMLEENLREGAQVNTINAFEVIFDEVFNSKIFEVRSKSQEFFDLLVENEEAREYWRKYLLKRVYSKLRSADRN